MNDSSNQLDKRFLILGDANKIAQHTDERKLKKIVRRDQKKKLDGIWGTLGWKRKKNFNVKITNSSNGNTSHNRRDSLTREIVREISKFNPEVSNRGDGLVERYINFDAAEFDIDWSRIKNYKDIPELRLDLFVDQREGAMVYYYHVSKRKLRQLNDQGATEQFIQCEATDDKFTTQRDRLTYYFKVLPPMKYEVTEKGEIIWGKQKRSTTFTIKLVTFKRRGGNPEEQMDAFFSKENLKLIASSKGASVTYSLFGAKKNGLLIYDPSIKRSSVATSKKNRFTMQGFFHRVDKTHPIDHSKKTLLLIHGTFSSTLGTFEDILKPSTGGSVLEQLMKQKGYEQVLAFDHPTISADAFKNVTVLKKLLGKKRFAQPVSLLSASRGCIVSQVIGSDKGVPFTVGKSLMFSPANGVGYFQLGEHVASGLKYARKLTPGMPATYIFALLQYSAKYFLNQPGCQQMTFGSKQLKDVLKSPLTDPSSKYTAVINDWDKKLIPGLTFVGIRISWKVPVDAAIKLVLGKKHDWVVGQEGQMNLPPKYKASKVKMMSTHCMYFTPNQLRTPAGKKAALIDVLVKHL